MRPPFRNENLNYLRSRGEAARACTRVSSDVSLLRDCRACLRVGARFAFGRDDAGCFSGNRRASSARCIRGDDAGRTRRRARSCGELAKRWPRVRERTRAGTRSALARDDAKRARRRACTRGERTPANVRETSLRALGRLTKASDTAGARVCARATANRGEFEPKRMSRCEFLREDALARMLAAAAGREDALALMLRLRMEAR